MAGRWARRGYLRNNAKADANQKDIVDRLRTIPGVSVIEIGRPIDLIVGVSGIYYGDNQGRVFLIEIKNPEGANRIEKDQQEFIEEWSVPEVLHVCRSLDDVMRVIRIPYKPAE